MSTHTLLLVDNSTTTRRVIQLALAAEPIQVAVADDGYQALDRIEADRPDVVLASTGARGVDGYAIARYVSQRPHLRQVAVLLLSGKRDATDDQRVQESGAKGILNKPIEPGAVVTRVKEALASTSSLDPAPPEQVPGHAEEFGHLSTAFDAIDATMTVEAAAKTANQSEIAITPEALKHIVNEAVANAMAAYERARGVPPEPGRDATIETAERDAVRNRAPRAAKDPIAAPPSPWKAELERLQGDMGLDDIEFAAARPAPPVEPKVSSELSKQMGVDDFAFEDAPVSAAEPAIAASASAEAVEAPPAGPDDAPAGGDEALDRFAPESSGDVEFGADDPRPVAPVVEPIPTHVPAPVPAPPEIPPVAALTPKEIETRTEEPVAALTPAPPPEVSRPTGVMLGTALANLASRFRSAIGERTERRADEVEAAATTPAPEPAAPVVTAPPRVGPRPAPAPKPQPAAKAPSEPLTPEEAAKTVFFTFDPIPPVPPPIPREPRQD